MRPVLQNIVRGMGVPDLLVIEARSLRHTLNRLL
jgi:hypothetical protein